MSEEQPLMTVEEIKNAFTAAAEAEKKILETKKVDKALSYLAKAVHDLQEAGIDVELLDMRPTHLRKITDYDSDNTVYSASLRIGQLHLPLAVYFKKVRESKSSYSSYSYPSYTYYETAGIKIENVLNCAFGHRESDSDVYKGLIENLVLIAAKQEVLRGMDDKGIFNVPSALRSEETKRKAALPRPALGGGKGTS